MAVMLLLCDSALAHKDRGFLPQSLVISFAGGEKVTFVVTNGRVTAITVRVGSAISEIPSEVCARLRDVRFETVRLSWNGSYPTAAEANYYYVSFKMGPVINRPNGDPHWSLMFSGGKFTRFYEEAR